MPQGAGYTTPLQGHPCPKARDIQHHCKAIHAPRRGIYNTTTRPSMPQGAGYTSWSRMPKNSWRTASRGDRSALFSPGTMIRVTSSSSAAWSPFSMSPRARRAISTRPWAALHKGARTGTQELECITCTVSCRIRQQTPEIQRAQTPTSLCHVWKRHPRLGQKTTDQLASYAWRSLPSGTASIKRAH
jgi:hypothetical protein